MTVEEIEKLLHLPGCRDKYDLRFTDGRVLLWHEYIPGCFVEASTLKDAVIEMGERIRVEKERRDKRFRRQV